MVEFSLPEDLSSVPGEDLSNTLEDAKTKFNELYESEDISNEALETMEKLAVGIEEIVAEQDRRTTASAKRTELASKAAVKAQEGDKGEGEEEEEEVEEEEEDDDEKAELPFKKKVKAASEEVAEAAEEEEEVVEASDDSETAITEETVSSENEDSKEGLVAANKPTSIAIPERGPLATITAAVDVPQFYVGQRLDPTSLADALHNKARMLSDSRGSQTVYPVATIERPFGEGYDLEGLDQASTWDRIAEMSKPSALTAAGGWCAPSQILYDLFETECTTPDLFALPTFRVTRGGIRWPVFDAHDETFSPEFVWTEADDIAATGGTPTKPCVRISCPTFTECRLDAVGLCVTAGNLIDRAYPEQVRWFIARAMRAYERNNATRKLNAVLADTVAVNPTATFGAAGHLIGSLLLLANDYRQVHSLCAGERLDITLPYWAKDIVKADVARQQGTLSIGNLPSDADVTAWLASVGLSVDYIQHWQNFAVTPATAWPASVDVLIGYPGSYVEFNQGRLDLGVIRDSVLNETNDYTAVWFEEFYCVGRRGPQSYLATIDVCADGNVGGRNQTTVAFDC